MPLLSSCRSRLCSHNGWLQTALVVVVLIMRVTPIAFAACIGCEQKCPHLSPLWSSTTSFSSLSETNFDPVLALVDPHETDLVKEIIRTNGSHWDASDTRLHPCTHILISLLLDEFSLRTRQHSKQNPAGATTSLVSPHKLSPIPRPHLHPWLVKNFNSSGPAFGGPTRPFPSQHDSDDVPPPGWDVPDGPNGNVDFNTSPAERAPEMWTTVEVRSRAFQTRCTRHKDVHDVGVNARQMDLLEYLVEENQSLVSLNPDSQAYLKFGNIYVGIYLRQEGPESIGTDFEVSYLDQFVAEARRACWTPAHSGTSSLDADPYDEDQRFVVSIVMDSILVYFVDYYHRDVLPL